MHICRSSRKKRQYHCQGQNDNMTLERTNFYAHSSSYHCRIPNSKKSCQILFEFHNKPFQNTIASALNTLETYQLPCMYILLRMIAIPLHCNIITCHWARCSSVQRIYLSINSSRLFVFLYLYFILNYQLLDFCMN